MMNRFPECFTNGHASFREEDWAAHCRRWYLYDRLNVGGYAHEKDSFLVVGHHDDDGTVQRCSGDNTEQCYRQERICTVNCVNACLQCKHTENFKRKCFGRCMDCCWTLLLHNLWKQHLLSGIRKRSGYSYLYSLCWRCQWNYTWSIPVIYISAT